MFRIFKKRTPPPTNGAFHQVKLFIILVSGFRQSISERTGMAKLFWKLRKQYVTNPHTYVMLRGWKDDFDELADLIERDAKPGARIILITYSWGAGRGLRKLIPALRKRRKKVNKLYVIDGVPNQPRPVWWPTQIIALLPYRGIRPLRVDGSVVDRCRCVRQTWNVPMGRSVRGVADYRERVFKGLGHNDIDDAVIVHQMILSDVAGSDAWVTT